MTQRQLTVISIRLLEIDTAPTDPPIRLIGAMLVEHDDITQLLKATMAAAVETPEWVAVALGYPPRQLDEQQIWELPRGAVIRFHPRYVRIMG